MIPNNNKVSKTQRDDIIQASVKTQRDSSESNNSIRVVVPEDIKNHYEIKEQLPTQGAEADILLAQDLRNDRTVIIKLYRQGIAPKTDVLEKIYKIDSKHVIQLYDHNQSEGVWYEVMEYAKHGSLRDILKAPVAPEHARIILQELSAALEHLHHQNIIHRDLKPENVLVRSPFPLDLVLTDFGIASVNEATLKFTSAHRTIKYAAPEASSGVINEKADWWSLGMIMLEVLTGKTPFDALSDAIISRQLSTEPVDLSQVKDANWKALLSGLLHRNDKHRWCEKEVSQWLQGENVNVVTDEVTAVANRNQHNSHNISYTPYKFEGVDYHTPKELAQGLVTDWETAIKHLSRGLILSWIKDEVKDYDLISFLMDLAESKNSPDIQLTQLLQKLAPSLPPIWHNWSLDDENLAIWAKQAINDDEKADELEGLFSQNILAEWSDKKKIWECWKTEWSEFEKTQKLMVTNGASKKNCPQGKLVRASILHFLYQNSEFIELRTKAYLLWTPVIKVSHWFNSYTDPSAMTISQCLLIIMAILVVC